MNKQVIYDLFEEKIKEQPESGVLIKRIETKSVLTKSNLPVSDYSVNPYVGCTHVCKKKLHDAGIRTTCFISPVFPGITDVTAIIDRVKHQCNFVWLENLNLRGSYKTAILAYIREKHSDLVPLSFDAPPVIVNFFYHEEIKKSAKKGGKKNA